MINLTDERLRQLEHHAKCGTNDATPPEIRQLVTDLQAEKAARAAKCQQCSKAHRHESLEMTKNETRLCEGCALNT